VAACGLLFLNAAATVEIVYTLRISYVLLAAACLLGLPHVIAGWRVAPVVARAAAATVVMVTLIAAIFGVDVTVADQARGGSQRGLIYLADLTLGLGVVGLLLGLHERGLQPWVVIGALVGGAVIAALYGIVQWPARHYDWGIANVNNALNPDAVTRGEVPQGNGLLLGWERVRGTFTEPLFFGLYLATMLPLIASLRTRRLPRRVTVGLAGGVIGFALLLASSFPAWVIATGALVIASLLAALGRRAKTVAALIAGVLIVASAGIVAVVGDAQVFATVTGREFDDLGETVESRTSAWAGAVEQWRERPVLGHGPGQSAVQLSRQQDPNIVNMPSAPVVLGSAQGMLFAALIDVGVAGVLAWLALLGSLLLRVLAALVREPSWFRFGVAAAAVATVGGSLVSGDRLEVHTWVVLGLALAVSPRPAAGGPGGAGAHGSPGPA